MITEQCLAVGAGLALQAGSLALRRSADRYMPQFRNIGIDPGEYLDDLWVRVPFFQLASSLIILTAITIFPELKNPFIATAAGSLAFVSGLELFAHKLIGG